MAEPKPTKRARVAFVNSHPIQYFVPLYRRINASRDIEAVPVYITKHGLRGDVDPGFKQAFNWDIDLMTGTDPIFVAGADTRQLDPGATHMIAPDIWNVVRTGNFDAVVIHGHRIGANHVATLAAKSIGIPIISRGETHLGLPQSPLREAARKALMGSYYRLIDGFLVIGSLNRAFYQAMGVPDAKLFSFPYTVDNERMMGEAVMSSNDRAAYRAKLGVHDDAPILLYASKFMPRKHPDDLISAARILKDRGLHFHLVLAGSGEMDDALRAQAASHPDLSIHFPGFVNQAELPRLFGASDIFVLPSQAEPWGLIINEAMCAGLPVVASREIGSVADLVKPGVNGDVFDATDVASMVDALTPMVADMAEAKRRGAASLKIIGAWNYDACVTGLRAALTALGALDGASGRARP